MTPSHAGAPAAAPCPAAAPYVPHVPHVLVVDDSAVVREALVRLLGRGGGMRVTAVPDPVDAMQRIGGDRPDVIVLDLEMPRMDGLTFLRTLMAADPIPVVVCSGLAQHGSEVAIRALREGAVEVIAKAQVGVRDSLEANADRLIEAVRAAATARVARRGTIAPGGDRAAPPATRHPTPAPGVATDHVVVIGASTGGVTALGEVLGEVPVDAPGIVVVQHMPPGFTAALARQLNESCRVRVAEARRGDRVLAGRALIAPGDRHVRLRRDGGHYVVDVLDGPRVSGHRPSVDVLFHAAATAAGRNALGVLLTGMGTDGAAGLLALRRAGATTVVQDEATSAVFGMPREAILRGAAEHVVPLGQIGAAVARFGRR